VAQRPSAYGQSLLDLGQDIGCFTDAQDFATVYHAHAQDFVADINKFGGAVQVLSEAAGSIAQNYKDAQDADVVGWKDVDNTVNNAQTLQNSQFT
jgi:hypothetical protein